MQKEKELLLELRSKLVGQLHTQPFTIYNDATIEELLRVRPKTIAELETVKGFPKDGKRIKGFGESIINIFLNSAKIENIVINNDKGELTVGVTLKKINAF